MCWSLGRPAPNATIAAALYKCVLVQLMLNNMLRPQTMCIHWAPCAGTYHSTIMAVEYTQASCVVKSMYGKCDHFMQPVLAIHASHYYMYHILCASACVSGMQHWREGLNYKAAKE